LILDMRVHLIKVEGGSIVINPYHANMYKTSCI
jgi:hypothetical protein